MTSKPQDEPRSLADVRARLDKLDRELVMLLSRRWQLTMAAVPFKVLEPAFQDEERRRQLLLERDKWGVEAGLPRQTIARLLNYHIDQVEDGQANIRKVCD